MITHDSQGRAQLGLLEFVIQAMIVLSLVAFALETLPRLTSAQRQQLRLFEIASVVVFTVEYLVRAVLARRPRAYLLSFFGIIDLLAILPFDLSLGACYQVDHCGGSSKLETPAEPGWKMLPWILMV